VPPAVAKRGFVGNVVEEFEVASPLPLRHLSEG
jgi:hypothetical protein